MISKELEKISYLCPAEYIVLDKDEYVIYINDAKNLFSYGS